MKLKQLLSKVEIKNDISSFCEEDILCISAKSQNKMQGGLFFCFNGKHSAIEMAKQAIKNGAKVLVVDKLLSVDAYQVLVDDARKVMGQISQNFYGTSGIKVIGITGTNGKTTTSYIIKHILEVAGKRVGVIGTNGVYFLNEFFPATLTTPDPIDLHEILGIMKKGKVDYVVMEVSAHAIYLNKIEGINFVAKVFTNFSQDHLDFFKDMQSYQNTKISYFKPNDLMIINADDECGQKIIQRNADAISYGINTPCDCFAMEVSRDGTSYILNINDNIMEIKSNLYGLFNVYNALAGAVCCYFLGTKAYDIKQGLKSVKYVDGRFNVIPLKKGRVIIDYAHTPDGLENVLKTARTFTDGKLLCVFGCGGDRDKSKRKLMGAIAEKYSDFCFVTNDNPRYEDPQKIIDDITQGFNKKNYYVIDDRSTAITLAISQIGDGDTVIICGKGAEKYMDIKGEKIPYSDFEVINSIKDKLWL